MRFLRQSWRRCSLDTGRSTRVQGPGLLSSFISWMFCWGQSWEVGGTTENQITPRPEEVSWWRGLHARPQPTGFPYRAVLRLWDSSPAWGSQAQVCCSAHCPHSEPLLGPTQPHPQAQRSPAPLPAPPPRSEGHWPPSPESPLQAGYESFPGAGQHPAARVACPEGASRGPPRAGGAGPGRAVRRQDACRASGSPWEPWACVSVQPGLPASPAPLISHGTWGGTRGAGVLVRWLWAWAVPPAQGQGWSALWPGLRSLQTTGPYALLSLSSPVREAVGGDGQAWTILLGARPSH